MKILDFIERERILLTAIVLTGYTGWQIRGWIGLILYPVAAVIILLFYTVVSATWMAWRYYRHNEYRTKWQATLYLIGIRDETRMERYFKMRLKEETHPEQRIWLKRQLDRERRRKHV